MQHRQTKERTCARQVEPHDCRMFQSILILLCRLRRVSLTDVVMQYKHVFVYAKVVRCLVCAMDVCVASWS